MTGNTPKRPRDPNQLLKLIADIATGEASEVETTTFAKRASKAGAIRLIERDAIDGVRPSANLLYGTIARAGIPAVGAVLTGLGQDGAKGLKLMRDAGCRTFAQNRASATVSEAPAAAVALG